MFPGTLPSTAQTALALLGQSDIVKTTYMAGGSALALQYFEDAEVSEMPMMLTPIDWEEVKKFFQDEVTRLWQ